MANLSMTYPKERSETTTSRVSGWWSSYRSRLTPYLFIAPNLLLFSIFVFFPLLYAAYISVHQWSLIDAPEFVGAQNYTRLLSDGQFWQSLTNTVIYSAATVPTSLILGLFLAIGEGLGLQRAYGFVRFHRDLHRLHCASDFLPLQFDRVR